MLLTVENKQRIVAIPAEALCAAAHLFAGPGGAVNFAQPARPQAGRFAVAPPDVQEELAAESSSNDARASVNSNACHLIVRRMRDVHGSIGLHSEAIRRRNRVNPLQMNPADLGACNGRRGRASRSAVRTVPSWPCSNRTARCGCGVVSMSHNWGGAGNQPSDDEQHGASTNCLIRADLGFEAINAMPQMSAIPVVITAI